MKTMQVYVIIAATAVLGACAATDTPMRNAPFETLPEGPAGAAGTSAARMVIPDPAADAEYSAPVTIRAVDVSVPDSLEVSEANRYLPKADIVWREDPPGDRRAQVRAIVLDAMTRGVTGLKGPAEADLQIRVVRFHALTEKARYTVGGVHSITFDMMLTEPGTDVPLTAPKRIRADLEAYGGTRALQAEAQGLTQKVRITEHLATVIRKELEDPGGYQNARLGLLQALNNI